MGGHRRKGKEYLQRVLQEAKSASALDQEFFAQVSSMQGWVALQVGQREAAISDYTHALELWTAMRGENDILAGWRYMLLGKAYAQAGQNAVALGEMQKGLRILEESAGPRNPKYLAAEFAYSLVLEQSGAHTAAAQLKVAAEQAFEKLDRGACSGCSISVLALH